MQTQSRRNFLRQVGGVSLLGIVGNIACTSKSIAATPANGDVIIPGGQAPSVFTKIIRGEIPSIKIYEDNYTFAFFPREQLNVGHTLVVPKIQIDYFLDVPEPYYSAVFQSAQKIGRAIASATQCLRVGTLIHGLEVPHFHYHLIPMYTKGDICKVTPTKHSEAELQAMQKKIIAAL